MVGRTSPRESAPDRAGRVTRKALIDSMQAATQYERKRGLCGSCRSATPTSGTNKVSPENTPQCHPTFAHLGLIADAFGGLPSLCLMVKSGTARLASTQSILRNQVRLLAFEDPSMLPFPQSVSRPFACGRR